MEEGLEKRAGGSVGGNNLKEEVEVGVADPML